MSYWVEVVSWVLVWLAVGECLGLGLHRYTRGGGE